MFGQAASVRAEADGNTRPVSVTADTQVVIGPVLQMALSPSTSLLAEKDNIRNCTIVRLHKIAFFLIY